MPCNTYELPTSGPPTQWPSIKEAAHLSNISARTLNRWADEGLILADRLGSGRGAWLVALNARNLPISTKPFRADATASGETSA
ncbi:MerR family DNA-binding transcriptional regulator [Myxococcus llanfairpwllgwyngyllgogerychwyrndrobwllllantysiliogogogochensis]|uniref:MerR family DNA-binding transcriptional regulator n=1 Tax=Myxococcus llanfairpwllgwyngyllgogerychwyrndrobwllllantysiliogogogochensis TaxID=2590453 RepID=A0A540X7N3_9BACT|nr:MerR family DNA-binding transcriptional regulator [Myxococcus llanfairpwllgwyngyllgogerychwyrndrobwllllantysiliogogogochensis]